jgi:hypothetical protein
MAVATRPTMFDLLPAVFRERDADVEGFLANFLAAFEALQDGLEREVDLIPRLFSLAPTPTVLDTAHQGEKSLQLDSATGLCEGDVVRIGDALQLLGPNNPRPVEFATVSAVLGRPTTPVPPRTESLDELLPTTVDLAENLRYRHTYGAPVRVVSDAGRSSELADAPRNPQNDRQALVVENLASLGLRSGAVLRIGDENVEYVEVVALATTQAEVTVAPPLVGPHRAGAILTAMELAVPTTPPADFRSAERSGAERVVEAPAHAGETVFQLDAQDGLLPDDLLQTLEADDATREVVRVRALPQEQLGPARLRGGLRLEVPLQRNHAPSTPVRQLTPTGRSGTLEQRVDPGETSLRVEDLELRQLAPGNVLRIGGAYDSDYVEVAEVRFDSVRLATPFRASHERGVSVQQFDVQSGGTGFLGWLAGLVGLSLRADRGERWNRELARAVSWIWQWRGTRRGIEAFLHTMVRGQAIASVTDPSNPLQVGIIASVGVDTVLCGRPHFFWADLSTNERDPWMYDPRGLAQLTTAAHQALRREKPAHTFYNLRLRAQTMQLGTDGINDVGARVGETTLLWDEPLVTTEA